MPGLVRKAGVTAQVSAYAIVGDGTAAADANDPRPMSWTGGTPTTAGTNRLTGVWIPWRNAGFTLTVPADTPRAHGQAPRRRLAVFGPARTVNTVGVYGPTIVVRDGRGGSADASFSWTVQAVVPPPPPTVTQRARAATDTALSAANVCAAIQQFYWEIGDGTAALASGSTGAAGSSPVHTAATPMAVASASKWVYGAYVAEKRAGVLTAGDIKHLHFRSGYTGFDGFGTCSANDWAPWTTRRSPRRSATNSASTSH